MKSTLSGALALALAAGMAPVSQASGFNPMNMMNPGKWFGGKDRDRYNDRYGPGPGYGPPPYGIYGPPGGPGYGPQPYGPPAAQPYPSSTQPYGPPTAPRAAEGDTASQLEQKDARIRELERRIDELEHRQAPPAPTTAPPTTYQYYGGDQTPPSGSSNPNYSNYPFRPLNSGGQ